MASCWHQASGIDWAPWWAPAIWPTIVLEDPGTVPASANGRGYALPGLDAVLNSLDRRRDVLVGRRFRRRLALNDAAASGNSEHPQNSSPAFAHRRAVRLTIDWPHFGQSGTCSDAWAATSYHGFPEHPSKFPRGGSARAVKKELLERATQQGCEREVRRWMNW